MKAFVAHPYSLTQLPIEDYRKIFAEVTKSYPSVRFTFADEKLDSAHILDRIEKMITEADFSLFDVSAWNANVALELGLAKGLRRPYYILFNPSLQGADDVPSDIKGLGRLQYNSLTNLGAQLSVLVQQRLSEVGFDAQSHLTEINSKIVDLISSSGPQSAADISSTLGISAGIVRATLTELISSRMIRMTGATKGSRYHLVQPKK